LKIQAIGGFNSYQLHKKTLCLNIAGKSINVSLNNLFNLKAVIFHIYISRCHRVFHFDFVPANFRIPSFIFDPVENVEIPISLASSQRCREFCVPGKLPSVKPKL